MAVIWNIVYLKKFLALDTSDLTRMFFNVSKFNWNDHQWKLPNKHESYWNLKITFVQNGQNISDLYTHLTIIVQWCMNPSFLLGEHQIGNRLLGVFCEGFNIILVLLQYMSICMVFMFPDTVNRLTKCILLYERSLEL